MPSDQPMFGPYRTMMTIPTHAYGDLQSDCLAYRLQVDMLRNELAKALGIPRDQLGPDRDPTQRKGDR